MAQAAAGFCDLALSYAPAAVVPPVVGAATPVPTLAVLSVGILSAALGVVAWSKAKAGSGKALSIVVLAASAGLALHGGQGLVHEVRAAAPYNMDTAAGGSVADNAIAYASPAPTITVTNTTGVRLKIVSNGNAAESGTCAVGAEVAPGASCTATPVCTPPAQPLAQMTPSTPVLGCSSTDVAFSFDRYNNGTAGTLSVMKPAPTVTFTPDPPATTWTMAYTNPTTTPTYDASGTVNNLADLGVTNVTVTATAPQGYGFGPNLEPTWTWSGSTYCGPQPNGGNGGN